jgi:DNA-directed RNA polymerase specialized sigma24 family protein
MTEAEVAMAAEAEFSYFVRTHELRLRQALVARVGPERARDAVADGLAHAWQHWDRVRGMENPAGYVYRVAQSRSRVRRQRVVFPTPSAGMPDVEPGLAAALGLLPERQRVAVLLVHGWGWTHQEVADLMEVGVSTVRNHLARGLERLRSELGVRLDG